METTLGTNYYSVKRGFEDLDPGDFWNRMRDSLDDPENDEILHIGKSSGGWCFSLHVIPDRGITDITGWTPYLLSRDRFIINEYCDPVTYEEMLEVITNRRRNDPCTWTPEKYYQNYAEPGPNNLVRHSVGRGCVRHGEGTWDYVEGNFS